MNLLPGTVVVHKTTGAYAAILAVIDAMVKVRMAKGPQENHAEYTEYWFLAHELETVEDHLRRNLGEMELKAKLIEEARERSKPEVELPKEIVN